MKAHQHRTPPRAFTLIELVMVLVILAILASAALNMVEVQVDQTRFEATQNTVEVIDHAVLGVDNARAADGSRAVSGFVADCGRLPLTLEELYLRPVTTLVPTFTSGSPAGDDEVTVTGGWNGPYLQLAIGGTTLPDGWAAGFEQYRSDGAVSAITEPVAILRSLGRDLAVGGTDYDADIQLVFQAGSDAVASGLVAQEENRWQKPVTVYIYYNDSATNPVTTNGQKIVVRVYGPVADVSGTITLGTIAESITDYISEAPIAVTIPDLAIGPRIIRAYQVSSDPTSVDQELSAVAQTVSVPTRLAVSRETSSIQLILRDN